MFRDPKRENDPTHLHSEERKKGKICHRMYDRNDIYDREVARITLVKFRFRAID